MLSCPRVGNPFPLRAAQSRQGCCQSLLGVPSGEEVTGDRTEALRELLISPSQIPALTTTTMTVQPQLLRRTGAEGPLRPVSTPSCLAAAPTLSQGPGSSPGAQFCKTVAPGSLSGGLEPFCGLLTASRPGYFHPPHSSELSPKHEASKSGVQSITHLQGPPSSYSPKFSGQGPPKALFTCRMWNKAISPRASA